MQDVIETEPESEVQTLRRLSTICRARADAIKLVIDTQMAKGKPGKCIEITREAGYLEQVYTSLCSLADLKYAIDAQRKGVNPVAPTYYDLQRAHLEGQLFNTTMEQVKYICNATEKQISQEQFIRLTGSLANLVGYKASTLYTLAFASK